MIETQQTLKAVLRGRFKKEYELKRNKTFALDIVVVGDIVEIEPDGHGGGVIVSIKERKNYLSRKAPRMKGAGFRGERLEQIIASNVDNLVIASSAAEPEFNDRFIDRLIVVGESSHIDIIIVVNKIDLDTEEKYKRWKEHYEGIGYEVFCISVVEDIGLDELNDRLLGKVSVIWGQSGVGKSSIINALYPKFKLKTGDISMASYKGKHTTVSNILLKTGENAFIIDTPGIREIVPYGIRKENLGHFFKDFTCFIQKCKFNTCTHWHEPECGIIEAVENGKISEERYQSYLNILATLGDGEIL